MTDKELLYNFAGQYNRPFTLETMAAFTTVSIESIPPILAELIKTEKVKQIEANPAIYVRCNRYHATLGYQHYKGWSFDLRATHQLLDILEQGKYKSIRDIAIAINRSRQWVYIYLEALASIEVINLVGYVYVVVSRKNVPKIGRKVQKGILGQMRNLNKLGAYRRID